MLVLVDIAKFHVDTLSSCTLAMTQLIQPGWLSALPSSVTAAVWLTIADRHTQLTQGMIFENMALVARGNLISEHHGSEPPEERVPGKLTPPEYFINSRRIDTQSSCEKVLFCVLEPQSKGQSKSATHPEATDVPPDTILAPILHLTRAQWHLPERSLHTHLKPHFLQKSPRGHLWAYWSACRCDFQLAWN